MPVNLRGGACFVKVIIPDQSPLVIAALIGAALVLLLLRGMLAWYIDRRIRKHMRDYVMSGAVLPRNKRGQFVKRR